MAELNFTRARLIEELTAHGAGVHPNMLQRWLSGEAIPRRHRLVTLLDVLGIVEREERAEAALLAMSSDDVREQVR
jgi:hypothetical protein